jgi:carboxylesterase
METYELVNKVLMPVDQVIGVGVDALKKAGLYEPLKDKFNGSIKTMMKKSFDKQYNLEVIGEENIPETGGCIIASNHRSWLDAQVLGVGTRRRLYFVAKADFKEWPMLRRTIDLADGIYVKRGGDKDALAEIIKAVNDGKAVVIFPEGTIPGEEDVPRWDVEKDTGLLRGHSGAVRIAMATGAPIIPCGLSGTGLAYPPEAYPRFEVFPPMPRPAPVTIRFGKPLYFKKPVKETTREDLAKSTKKIMLAMSELIDFTRDFVPTVVPIRDKTEPSFLPRYAYTRSPKGLKAGTKAPLGVLVLHGFTSDIHCVDPLVPYLDTEDLPYRFPILRGHGTKYQDMEGVTNRDWFEDGENALLDLHRECDKILVVGLSMGGLVALELAARHRDKVVGVATVAAALKFADPMAFMTPALARIVKFWPSPDAYHDAECRKRENRNYPKFATAAFASLYEYAHKVTNLLSFVKAPIVIIESRKDQVVNPVAATIIHKKVSSKDKNLVWFEKSGHEMLLDMEAPAVIQTVMTFVRRIRAQQA